MSEKKLWWRDGIIYQVYPRSFQDTTGDGIGDLRGIIQHLDYLKDLGIDGIWLSPINPSPDVDFGYDVSDYNAIDPKFGTLSDFYELLEQAHKRDIRIIMDLVLNHTSDQHQWFQESRKSKDNPYHDWYIWRDPAPGGKAPNNWTSMVGGSAWKYDASLGQYYYHMFFEQQPDVNWRNPQVYAAMLDVFRFWLEKGVDGFRLDIFNEYFKDEQFRDNPTRRGLHLRAFDRTSHVYDNSQPEMLSLLNDIRKLMDCYEDRYVVGETFLVNSQKARAYIGKDRLHAGFDYAYANSGFSARAFGKAIQDWDSLHGREAWPNYFLNNHDTSRSSTRYNAGQSDARLKLLATMHLTVRGTPYLYYGEEIGMRDINLTYKEIQDPVGKTFWPLYKGRDGCRSPMQWDARPNAGFSTGSPWLRVNTDYPIRNVVNQQASSASLLAFYKALIQLRREHPALHKGTLEMHASGSDRLLAYWRSWNNEKLLVVLNFLNLLTTMPLPGDPSQKWTIIFNGNEPITSQVAEGKLHLPGYGLAILRVNTE